MIFRLSREPVWRSHTHIVLTSTKEREMATTTDEIRYTDEWAGDSHAVEGALYDKTTKTFYVQLASGSYVYDNVPEDVWNSFKSALSKGRFYAKTIKRDYGPGTALDWDALDYAEPRDDSVPAADMGPVTNTFVSSYNFGGPVTTTDTVGTPKNLSYSDKAVVDGKRVVPARTFNLQAPLLEQKLEHVVHFRVDGGTDVKQYTLSAESVSAAVATVNDIANALGLEFTVTEVCVRFE